MVSHSINTCILACYIVLNAVASVSSNVPCMPLATQVVLEMLGAKTIT